MSQISPLDFLKHLAKVLNAGNAEKVVDAVMSDTHPTDHTYVDDPAMPGTCQECHWVADETTASCCGGSARSHVQRALEMMAAPRVEVEVIFIEL